MTKFGSFKNIEFEEVGCLICGHDNSESAGQVCSHGAVFNYVICSRCGLKYMNPRPTTAWYGAHYADHFWEYKETNRGWHDERRSWRFRDFFRRGIAGRQRRQSKRLAVLVPLLRAHSSLSSDSKLLDIGCAFGAIGAGLRREFGCEVWGVEPNVTARRVATKENGIRILADSAEVLSDLKPAEHRFDVILMSNVLENILDPIPVLSACRRLLNERGVLCIHTPNFYYYDCMNPYHPYVFSAETVAALLGKAKLGVAAAEFAPIGSARNGIGPAPSKADRFATIFASVDAAPVAPANRVNVSAMLQEQSRSLALLEAL